MGYVVLYHALRCFQLSYLILPVPWVLNMENVHDILAKGCCGDEMK